MKQTHTRVARTIRELRSVASWSLVTVDARAFSTEARLVLTVIASLSLISLVAFADTRGWLDRSSDTPAQQSAPASPVGNRQSTPFTPADDVSMPITSLIEASAAALGFASVEHGSDTLLESAPGWCRAQRANFGGRPGDNAAVNVRFASFHTPDAAVHAVSSLSPTALDQLVTDHQRLVDPLVPTNPPTPLPDAVVKTFTYGKRMTPEFGAVPKTQALPVWLLLMQSNRTVALIEVIGLSPPRMQALTAGLVRATQNLPPTAC
jgi:hypothetical protein